MLGRTIRFRALHLAVLFISFAAFSAAQASDSPPIQGLYEISGTHSGYGEYSGQMAIHGSTAERIIHWKTYRYPVKTITGTLSEELESVWTGTVTPKAIEFSLPLSNVLTEYEGYAPTVAELKAAAHVVIQPTEPSLTEAGPITFSVPGEGTYIETWKRIGDAPAEPLWKDQRQTIDATGSEFPTIVKIALWLGVDQAIDWYRNQPQLQPYLTREEFRDQKQYFTLDTTDADFYASHPNTLRITNHTLNPLSLAEASMKRNAFVPKLQEKADFFRRETLQYTLNSAGLLELFERDARGDKTGRSTEYDSALWTAMLGYAEFLRYQVTQDPASLQVFRAILEGELTLVEITGNRKEFARSIAISPPEESLGPGWVQGTGKYAHLKWRSGGNNDMIKGLILTMILAHKVVGPQERELRQRILNAAKSLLSTDAAHFNTSNTGLVYGLIALWDPLESIDESELERYSSQFLNLVNELGSGFGHNGNFYYGGIADWSGIHLSMITSLCQVLLSQELQTTFPDSTYQRQIKEILKAGKTELIKAHDTYRVTRRDFLTIFAYLLSADLTDRSKLRAEALDALQALREMPAPRNIGQGTVDLTKNPNWSYSAWPRVPWKAIGGFKKLKSPLDFKLFEQGAYSYPVYETLAWSSNYLWKDSPFGTKFSSDPRKEPFSADYLLVYWASRASGLLSAQE